MKEAIEKIRKRWETKRVRPENASDYILIAMFLADLDKLKSMVNEFIEDLDKALFEEEET